MTPSIILLILAIVGFMLETVLVTSAVATQWTRVKPTDVIPPDWEGTWKCNGDGRAFEITLKLEQVINCNGGICTNTGTYVVKGQAASGNGPAKTLEQSSFGASDPASTRKDHLLPLRFEDGNNWILMMHTWDRRYASGYTNWDNIPFGLQCVHN
jgi:hypothetical protein